MQENFTTEVTFSCYFLLCAQWSWYSSSSTDYTLTVLHNTWVWRLGRGKGGRKRDMQNMTRGKINRVHIFPQYRRLRKKKKNLLRWFLDLSYVLHSGKGGKGKEGWQRKGKKEQDSIVLSSWVLHLTRATDIVRYSYVWVSALSSWRQKYTLPSPCFVIGTLSLARWLLSHLQCQPAVLATSSGLRIFEVTSIWYVSRDTWCFPFRHKSWVHANLNFQLREKLLCSCREKLKNVTLMNLTVFKIRW